MSIIQRTKQTMLRSFALILLATLSTVSQAKGILTPIIIIGDYNDFDIELCAANFSNKDEQAAYLFEPSIKDLGKEEIVFSIGPGDSKCRIFTPLTAGVLSRIVHVPPGFLEERSNPAVLTEDELLSVVKLSNVFEQVWVSVNGGRTAQVRACPTPGGICPAMYLVVGNYPG